MAHRLSVWSGSRAGSSETWQKIWFIYTDAKMRKRNVLWDICRQSVWMLYCILLRILLLLMSFSQWWLRSVNCALHVMKKLQCINRHRIRDRSHWTKANSKANRVCLFTGDVGHEFHPIMHRDILLPSPNTQEGPTRKWAHHLGRKRNKDDKAWVEWFLLGGFLVSWWLPLCKHK